MLSTQRHRGECSTSWRQGCAPHRPGRGGFGWAGHALNDGAAVCEADAFHRGVVGACVADSLLHIPVIGSIARGDQRLNCSMRGSIVWTIRPRLWNSAGRGVALPHTHCKLVGAAVLCARASARWAPRARHSVLRVLGGKGARARAGDGATEVCSCIHLNCLRILPGCTKPCRTHGGNKNTCLFPPKTIV